MTHLCHFASKIYAFLLRDKNTSPLQPYHVACQHRTHLQETDIQSRKAFTHIITRRLGRRGVVRQMKISVIHR